MGNSSVSGGLHVQLEQGQASPGEPVAGTVYCQINQVLPPSILKLTFKREQKTDFFQHSQYSKTRCKGKEKEVYFKTLLHEFKEELQTGGYSIPFNFVLPSQLPGSLIYSNKKDHANIEYKIKATLEPKNKKKL